MKNARGRAELDPAKHPHGVDGIKPQKWQEFQREGLEMDGWMDERRVRIVKPDGSKSRTGTKHEGGDQSRDGSTSHSRMVRNGWNGEARDVALQVEREVEGQVGRPPIGPKVQDGLAAGTELWIWRSYAHF